MKCKLLKRLSPRKLVIFWGIMGTFVITPAGILLWKLIALDASLLILLLSGYFIVVTGVFALLIYEAIIKTIFK